MNGNDLNNMAKRYKEEMMRIYQKSSAASRQNTADRNGGILGRGAGMSGNPVQTPPASSNTSQSTAAQPSGGMGSMPMPRDAAGTPVPGVPGASFYGMNDMCGGQGQNQTMKPTHHPNQNQNPNRNDMPMQVQCDCRFPSAESIINSLASTPMPLPAASGNDSSVQPRTADASDNQNVQDTGDVRLRSVIINTTPENAAYTMPSQNDNEGEIMPDFALPEDVPADSDEVIPSTARFMPSQAWISMTGDNSWGFLQVEVYTNDGAYPLQGAIVIVKKRLASGIGLLRLLFTDRNGLTPTIALPAPAIMQPTADAVRPFSAYEITVIARGYYTLRNVQIPIYAGSKTVQPIDMIPLPNYPMRPQPRTDGSADIAIG